MRKILQKYYILTEASLLKSIKHLRHIAKD